MVHCDTTGTTCARLSSLDAVRAATLLSQYVDLDVRLYYVSVQNLVYVSGNEMTEAFTAGIMIFIEQFRAGWPWSIGVLES